ncbi:MAG: hypothetical protein QG646_3898 [Euryarchaeota archaeon]|nr:hypothetical protein [Euryarchaeota archaeon]
MANRDNPEFLSADTIKSDKVVNAAGDDLGKIEDLMIDLDNGRVGYAVLSFGGLLGMGDKLFAIPWQALSLRLHEHAFTLDIPKDVLEKAEGFDKDNWPVTREELSRTYTYYGYQPYWQTVSGRTTQAGTYAGAQGVIESQGPAHPGSRENPEFLSADSIKSDKLVNRDGDNIGKFEELMIDLQDGRIAYAVLSHGGFLGIGSKLFAIPWQSFSLRVHEHAFVLNIPKGTLDKAQGLDKDKWPLTRDELSRTYTYYGYKPYWQTGAVAGAAVAAGTAAGMQGVTEAERKARMETERRKPIETEAERKVLQEKGRTKSERQTATSRETVSEKVTRTETEIREPTEKEEGRKARQERERLEALKGTEEEKVSQLEKQRMEKERQAQAERECLARLEREQAEAERQANAEREKLARLERDLQEATRREKTEEVTRLEKEMREVKIQEETQRSRVTQLEKERTEVEVQAQIERERLTQLEKERMEAEKREETEKEKFAQLEKRRTEAQTQEETGKETLTRLERERMETERQAQTERERLTQLERERSEVARREAAEPGRVASMGGMAGRVSPDFLPSSTIKGYKVVNTNGDDLGRVEDLMIDLNTGRVAYAALSLGGFMGMSDKLFAVPWQALSYIPAEQAFILAVPRNILEKAEGFDKDKCPTTREQLSRSYTHYGYRPYWETGAARSGGRLDTAEELMAAEDVEEIEEKERKVTDPEKLAELEKQKKIAERRAHKYD